MNDDHYMDSFLLRTSHILHGVLFNSQEIQQNFL